MLYILYGADEFSLREELGRIRDGLGDRESLASNTTLFEGKQVSLNQLMDACMALPFLGTHRLVIVEGLLARAVEEKGEWGGLKERVGGMPPSTALVLIDGELKKSNALLKGLSPLAEVKEFTPLKGEKLRGWIRRRVQQGGGTIDAAAVSSMASLVGDDLWVLSGEIEKLLTYAAGCQIEEEDVAAVVSYAREASVFAMVDALVEGRAAGAARLLHQLLDGGATAPYLLVMVARQLRMLVQAKELSQQRAPRAEMKSQLGTSSDFVLDKALEQSRHYSMERLEGVYRRLLETDLSIKGGVWRGELALDLLVAELCA